jgi:hypothetical protein
VDEVVPLLDDAERSRWPAGSNDDAWLLLATWAFQTECLQVDEAENLAWENDMRSLLHQNLAYSEFVTARMEALAYRLRTRKLAQRNLQYKYGFRETRRRALVQRDVRRFYRSWSDD